MGALSAKDLNIKVSSGHIYLKVINWDLWQSVENTSLHKAWWRSEPNTVDALSINASRSRLNTR